MNDGSEGDATANQYGTFRPPGKKVQQDRQAADLRGTGNEVEQIGGDQRYEAKLVTKPRTDHGEDGLSRDNRDPATHFHINNNSDSTQDNRPEKLVAKQGARLRGEHDLAEIDEAAECRHDPEGDAEQFPHSPAFAAVRDFRIAWTRCRTAGRSLSPPFFWLISANSRESRSSCSMQRRTTRNWLG